MPAGQGNALTGYCETSRRSDVRSTFHRCHARLAANDYQLISLRAKGLVQARKHEDKAFFDLN